MPKKAVHKKSVTLQADVVRTRSFVLVDERDRDRVTLSALGKLTIMNLLDDAGRPRLVLQTDSEGSPSITLFDSNNVPGVSLSITENGRGICVQTLDGRMISIGVPGSPKSDAR